MAEVVAVAQIDRTVGDAARAHHDLAVGADERAHVGLGEATHLLAHQVERLLVGESGAEFVRRGGARGHGLMLQLGQRQVDRPHDVRSLLGEHGGDVAGVALGVLHRVAMQAEQRQHGRDDRRRDQRGRGHDQATEGQLALAVGHR
jgi:hypothetical protein